MARIALGDRIEHTLVGCTGTVLETTAEWIKVKWDNGQTGILYDHPEIVPNVKHLLLLKTGIIPG